VEPGRTRNGPRRAADVPILLRLTGQLDVSALERALTALVERGEPSGEFLLATLDLSGERRDLADVDTMVEIIRAEESLSAVDPDSGPLARGWLVRIGPDDHVLSLMLHDLVADEDSAAELLDDLPALYENTRVGRSGASTARCSGLPPRDPAQRHRVRFEWRDLAVAGGTRAPGRG
jgi:hypothetical protein